MFASIAHAMGGAGTAGGAAPTMQEQMISLLPIPLMLGIFYFLLIRPQQKRAKEQKEMIHSLKKGDTVITTSGFIGRIVDVDEDVLTIDLGETKVQLGRAYVVGLAPTKMKGGKKDKPVSAKDADKGESDKKDNASTDAE